MVYAKTAIESMAQSLRPQVGEDATTSTEEASDRLFAFTPLSESAALMTSPATPNRS
jgi:hypothetical protein